MILTISQNFFTTVCLQVSLLNVNDCLFSETSLVLSVLLSAWPETTVNLKPFEALVN